MFQILTILHRLGHRVTFLPDNLADIPPYTGQLTKRGIEVVFHPFIKSIREYLETHGKEFDFVILSRCDFARKHISEVRTFAPQARLIFDTVDLHFVRESRLAEMTDDLELLQKSREKQQLEYSLIDQADQTWVVSPAEKELLLASHPDSSIEVVSNIVDIPGSATPFVHRRHILFIGSFQHPPNTDAVLFFTTEIFPLIQKRLPDVRFYIIGDKAPPEVVALAGEHVIVTGFQPDVGPFFNAIKLSIAPLRYGAGVKGKINQSMGFGVPVVATSIAVEGMSLQDGEEVVIADEPALFASKLVGLYQSEELWERISQNGITKTEGVFSVEAARVQLSKLLDWRNDDPPVSPLVTAPFSQPVTAPVLRPT
jgi:glycosyltransferase involved in cell wall biosynthesis